MSVAAGIETAYELRFGDDYLDALEAFIEEAESSSAPLHSP